MCTWKMITHFYKYDFFIFWCGCLKDKRMLLTLLLGNDQRIKRSAGYLFIAGK